MSESANVKRVGSTIVQACATLGITVDEAFELVGFATPPLNEMHHMPVSIWIKLCDLLCLTYDQASMEYDESVHLRLIQHRRNLLIESRSLQEASQTNMH